MKKLLSDDEKNILKLGLAGASISDIARVVKANWQPVGFAARPYLDAMTALNSVHDKYGADSGEMIVIYFLCNARKFTGDVARLVKAELNKRLKSK